MNHKKGDVVRIRDSAWIDAHKHMHLTGAHIMCGTESFLDDMFQFAGRKAVIKGIDPFGEYELDIDDGEWSWNDLMFEDGGELPE
jgi:hypothetical protein